MKNKIKVFMLLAVAALMFAACEDEDPNTTAGFTFSPDENIQVGDTVFFSNTSAEAANYEWAFGDGETSTEESPVHVYAAPGTFDVTLTATNGGIVSSVTQQVGVAVDYSYIINYGSFSGDKSTITAYDKYADDVENGFYTTVNGVAMVSNVQYAYSYLGNIYCMNNNADGLSWVESKTFKQTANNMADDFVKPRYCIGNGDYLYVACYEGDVWYDSSLGYVAKFNVKTNTVEKIDLPGGPEGMAIVNGKLYVALRYSKQIAVVDLTTEAITFIDVQGQPVFIKNDPQGNLYVVISRNWDDSETQTGIGYFNTQTNTMVEIYALDGILNTYDNVISANIDFSKLYISYTTSTDYSTYISTGSVGVFDVSAKQFESENLIDGVEGINGTQVIGDKILCYVSPAATSNGKVIVYSADGTKEIEHETGISPIMMVHSK